MWGGIPTVEFTAVVEHSGSTRFLPDTPLNILKANKSAGVPWLAGVNAQDGSIIAEREYILLIMVLIELSTTNRKSDRIRKLATTILEINVPAENRIQVLCATDSHFIDHDSKY